MQYLLDTHAIIAMLHDPAGLVSQRVRRHQPAEIGVSVIVMHELYFGAFRSQRVENNLAIVDGLRFEVVPFDQEDARRAGEIRSALAASGTPIGGDDLLIAGQASARDLTLVSRNLREFTRVGHLRVQNWEDEPVR